MFKTKDIIKGYVEAITMDIEEYGIAVLNIECIELNLENDLIDIAYKKAIEKNIFILGGLGEQLEVVTNEEYNKLMDKFISYIVGKINKELRYNGYKCFNGEYIQVNNITKILNDYEVAYTL